ncbi:hypothetical protein ACFVXE_16940 [Streptomyces sp. NPDC058231]|uniref:hypothetical protein n=1 Tax=Streptomyces sp. NPDC058231 TaxID=3346392 RepID=UPI0036E1E719
MIRGRNGVGASVSDWGSFVDETPSSPPPMPGYPPEPAADEDWGAFADAGDAPAGPVSAGPPVPPPGVAVPSPEAVASLLKAGETLWAYVDGTGAAYLGSGCALTVVDGDADGFDGWRPVVVVDPAALTVRPVPLALAEPAIGTATAVSELYQDPEPSERPGSRRAPAFPVGQGPDLDALLAEAVAEERARVTTRADETARQAQQYAETRIRAEQDAARQSVRHWQQRAQAAEAEVVRLETELQRGGWLRRRGGGPR